jgi:hypothetical protein
MFKALLGVLSLAVSTTVFAATLAVRVVMPSIYTDNTTIPATSRVGAAVYCGSRAGQYVRQWFTAGKTDTIDVEIDLLGSSYCAVTAFATLPDGTTVRESEFSTEFQINPITPNISVNPQIRWETPLMCSTVCTVNRTR